MSKIVLTDELLKEAAMKAMKIEASVYGKIADQAEGHEFSEEHEKKIRELVRQNLGKAGSEHTRHASKKMSLKIRIALVAVVIMIMGSMTVLAVEPLRIKVYRMVERLFSDYTDVTFEEIEEEMDSQAIEFNPEDYPRKLKMVPKGYKLVDETIDEDLFFIMQIYMNDEERDIVYQQVPIDYSNGWNITSDGNKARKVFVNGEKAYLLTDEKDYRTIVLAKDGFGYLLGGYEDTDELIDCLESVFESK